MTRAAIGIDIGGTAVKLGLVAGDGTLLARRQLAFERDLPFAGFVEHLGRAADELQAHPGGNLAPVGVALPGYVDPATGVSVDGTYNVPALAGQSLPQALSQRLGVPVVAQNDGVAAAWGELLFGAGQGLARFVMLTIGTGIGGAVVIDGRPVTGSRGEPPELGAMVLDAAGPVNYAGLPGTLEAFAAVPGLKAAYGRDDLDAAAIFARAAAGEAAAAEAVDRVCRRIAQACGALVNALNLEACILGGGVSHAGEPLRARVAHHLPCFTWPLLARNCEVRLALRGNDAGLLGAAARAASAVDPP
ncbi:ROK family protein [Chelatococcus reniformis]|uniref:Sugar kinase n=1 Tax=Chelatococcus reniformis TaxID=1494448 RepID=A0A916XPL0_9HYPH|nr:ROK family protein [Chelatococcus reniformis]GGC88885.1 sugar kinase [Chelatococcus reniformis]